MNLTLSLDKVEFLDCDVEEPNAHLFLKPQISETEPVNLLVPQVSKEPHSFAVGFFTHAKLNLGEALAVPVVGP